MPQDFNPSKSELKHLLRVLNKGLKALKPEDLLPRTPCPDSWTMASYVTGALEPKAQRAINAHIAFCDACFEDYVALAGPDKVMEIISAEGVKLKEAASGAQWQNFPKKAREFAIYLGKTYGPRALIGPIRIVAEQPAFAMRGGEPSKTISKVLEMPVGENTYSIELRVTEEGSLSCDIAGFHIPLEAPLTISVRARTGEVLITTQSDKFGNSHFKVPAPSPPDDLRVLTLNLEGNEQHALFFVPGREQPA